ncbi:MAG: hypothetical protein ACRCXB_15960 [Aeromonadaceae bacterium]
MMKLMIPPMVDFATGRLSGVELVEKSTRLADLHGLFVVMWCSPKLNSVSLSIKLTALGGGVHHITTDPASTVS